MNHPDPLEEEQSSKPDQSAYASQGTSIQTRSQTARQMPASNQGVLRHIGKSTNPGSGSRAFETAAKNSPPAKVPWQYRLRPTRERTHRAYWDVTSTLSLIVNAILIGLLIIMAGQIKNLKSTMNDLLGGVYGDFAKINKHADPGSVRNTRQPAGTIEYSA